MSGFRNKTSGPKEPDMDDYRSESDLRALIEAEKIKKDPKRFRSAMSKRDEMRGHLASVRAPRGG
jgi:hypothetical protein